MPSRAPLACRTPGCPDYATTRRGWCARHELAAFGSLTRGRSRPMRIGWQVTRRRLLDRGQNPCVLCLREAVSVDHIVPRSLGGSDTDDNLRSLCGPCHQDITAAQALAARGESSHIAADPRRQRVGWTPDERSAGHSALRLGIKGVPF